MQYKIIILFSFLVLTGCVVGKNVQYVDTGDTNETDATVQILKANTIQPTMENGVTALSNKEYVLSRLIFEKLAAQENPDAQIAMGVFYLDGLGVNKNQIEAGKWFKKAAIQGHAPAQYFLGRLLAESTQPNYTESMKWLRAAADQNFGEAENYIGNMYETGTGVTQDRAEAARWYKKANESTQ